MVIEETLLGTVRVFGPFDLRDAGGEAVRLPARSASALVAYLALRWRGAARHEIAETLWPGGEHEQARAALRTAVHRVRQTLGEGAVVDEDGRLRLTLESDVLHAARRRRARRRAADADEAITVAREEWAIVRQEVLAGWDDEWIEPLRDDARLLAHECGLALARLLEERGESAGALEALDGILSVVPHHAEALEAAMRLENGLHGRERALARAADARASLPVGEGFTLPGSVRRLERALRDGASGFLAPPEAFADGADLALIGHMVEGSLRQGGTAALTLLAEQAMSPVCLRHPYRTLDLLKRALGLSEGFGPERLATFVSAVILAINLPDHETTHELCDVLIENLPPDHRVHNGAVMAKGTVYFEARDFDLARTYTERAVVEATTEDRRIVATAQLGVVDLHELRLDLALERLQTAIDVLATTDREDRHRNTAALEGHICSIRVLQGDFDAAREIGEVAAARLGPGSPADIQVSPYLGLALFGAGRRKEGVDRIRYGLRESHRERVTMGFARSIDASAIALSQLGREDVARSVLDAGSAYRRGIPIPRSPAELRLIEVGGLDPLTVGAGPLRLQSAGALSEWLGEALEGALSPV